MIYTKTGDKGLTSLLGGTRVKKYSIRVEAYGSLDELNAFLGNTYDILVSKYDNGVLKDKKDIDNLKKIINTIFSFQSIISCENSEILKSLPIIESSQIEEIENWIDEITSIIGGFDGFVLPIGDIVYSNIHISRTITRRTERILYRLNDEEGEIDKNILIYINRMSDYLFVLSRKIIKDLGRKKTYRKFGSLENNVTFANQRT